MRSFDRLGCACGLAVFLATFTTTPLTRDSSYLGLSWVLTAVVAGLGMLLRRARLSAPAVLSGQLLVLLGFVLALAATMPGEGEPIYDHLGYLWASGVEHMQSEAAPMSANDGVKLMFVSAIGLMAVLTDLLACGLSRPVWALGPPFSLFLVPAIALRTETGIVAFACVAMGYLGILLADGLNMTARWTRGLSRDSAEDFGTATPVVWRAAGLVGAPALAVALVLGIALPTLALPGFGLGNGSGRGGPITLTDPTIDLRRNLNLPDDTLVLTYRSSSRSDGLYLRLASLPQFSAAGWTNVTSQLTTGRQLGPIPGAADNPAAQRSTTIEIRDFGSEYLPLPYAPRSFDARGDWAYDPNSLVVLSIPDGRGTGMATRNLSYTVVSNDVSPTAEQLAAASAGTPADVDITRTIPPDLPQSLIDLTRRVIRNAATPAARASAIQRFLRASDFTYSTQQLPGSGYVALENFLLRDRRGYCEQFAAAMAMMARIAGIPTRVAVGFLPGERQGDQWIVTAHKMHAWPELYFAGYGWVRFEPTPGSVSGDAPVWSLQGGQQSGSDPSLSVSASAGESSSAASGGASASSGESTAGSPSDARDNLLRTLLLVALAVVGLCILAAPATIRVRRRVVRLSPDAEVADRVEAAWAEIRDTVVDYGGNWPSGSPRTIGREIAEQLDEPESAAMGAVATLVERSRYSRGLTEQDATRRVGAMAREISRGLALPQSRWRRLRALVLPPSLFRRRT